VAITLVPKYVRALAEQLNAYYRVFRGTDPDSIDLRLNGGGRFAVHHSGTNAVVFQVTDSGATGSYQPGDITDPDIADQTIVNRHVNNAAAIAVTKIAHVGANNVLKSNGTQNVGGPLVPADIPNDSITSAKIVDDSIMNADVNANAGIAITKVAHVGVNNVLRGGAAGTANQAGQVLNTDLAGSIAVTKLVDLGANNVLRSDGAGNVAGKIVTNDITIDTLNGNRIQTNTLAPAKITNVTAGQVLKDVGSGVVGGGLVVDANVAAAGTANIALGKLAPGATGVLKSNGTTITAGNLIVTGDMALDSINGDRLLTGSVPGSKISGGAPPPNGTGAADAWKAYATDSAGTTVALRQVQTEMLVANAVTRVHGAIQLNTAQCNSAAFVTLSDVTVPSSGGYFFALVGGYASNSVASATTNLAVKVDAAAAVVVGGFLQPAASPSYGMPLLVIYPIGVIAAGAGHHVILQWSASTGITTITVGYYTVLELLR